MYIVHVNFGNESIALLQWLANNLYTDVHVVYINTKSFSEKWKKRLEKSRLYVEKLGFQYHEISSSKSFFELVTAEKNFPVLSHKFCATFLKGIPLLEWIDEHDPKHKATIVFPTIKASSKYINNSDLQIENCDYLDGRTLLQPIFNIITQKRNDLIKSAGFSVLVTPAQECGVCINFTKQTLSQIEPEILLKLNQVQNTIKQKLLSNKLDYSENINNQILERLQPLDLYYQGCGNIWGCGL